MQNASSKKEKLEFFAPCPRGLDACAAEELRSMGLKIRPLQTGVSFFARLRDAYRVCLFSRTVSRVMLVLSRIDAHNADALYAGVAAIAWEEHFTPGATLSVHAHGTNDALRNTQFTAQRVKDAICDRLRERTGERPSVSRTDADIQISITVRDARATVYLNLSGAPLHQRGYRDGSITNSTVQAPLKEALAAGMLLLAGWPARAATHDAFCDPLCGSGTLAIEAALIATDTAPGLQRPAHSWGFSAWAQHDAAAWDALLAEAHERAEKGRTAWKALLAEGAESPAETEKPTEAENLATAPTQTRDRGGYPRIFASDIDPAAVYVARENARRAGVDDLIDFGTCDFSTYETAPAPTGLLATNPPYGERLLAQSQLPALYSQLGSTLRLAFENWHAAIITPDITIDSLMGLEPAKAFSLNNGAIPVSVRIYDLSAEAQQGSHTVTVGEDTINVFEEHTQQFANRLKRRHTQLRKWARKNNVYAYRVYDADLPDYNVAVDLYINPKTDDRYAVVSEYAAPSEIDQSRARRRAIDALTVTPAVIGIAPDHVLFKRRTRKAELHSDQVAGRIADGYMADARFNAQPATKRPAHTRRAENANSVCLITEEHGLRFKINLSDYLDTGLFLDHRIVRETIMRMVSDQLEQGATQHVGALRALNLFAYTGTATVHAAAGGATHTTTVDMSATYLDWARENMALNHFAGPTHSYEQADCLTWIQRARRNNARWDFIFVDPPTFSNSKRMGDRTWDVQRDHVELLRGVTDLLAPRGQAIFSCNLRTFKPDEEALAKAGITLQDITASTIDVDFARNPRIHKVYLIRKA